MMPRKCGTIPNSIGTSYWEYTYDGRGNLVSNDKYTRTTSGMAWQNEETYVYDETNHMVDGKNEKGERSLYTYNGLGLRVGRELIMQDNTHGYTDFHDETPSVETGLNKPEVAVESYVIDYTSPTFRTLTMEEEGGFDYRWVYGLDKLSVKITSEGTNWWGQNVKQDILKDYLHQDRLGNTTNLSDKFGRVVGRADYNEWGEITYKDALDITSAYRRIYPQLNYTGHDWDDVLGMYYAKARFYDPDAKRFVELDPVKGSVTDPLSLVSYLYCVDNPLRWVDPLGLLNEGNGSNKVTTYQVTKNNVELRPSPQVAGNTKLSVNASVTDCGVGTIFAHGSHWRKVSSKKGIGWIDTQYLKAVTNKNSNSSSKKPEPKPVVDVQKLTNSEHKHRQNQEVNKPDPKQTLNEAKQEKAAPFVPLNKQATTTPTTEQLEDALINRELTALKSGIVGVGSGLAFSEINGLLNSAEILRAWLPFYDPHAFAEMRRNVNEWEQQIADNQADREAYYYGKVLGDIAVMSANIPVVETGVELGIKGIGTMGGGSLALAGGGTAPAGAGVIALGGIVTVAGVVVTEVGVVSADTAIIEAASDLQKAGESKQEKLECEGSGTGGQYQPKSGGEPSNDSIQKWSQGSYESPRDSLVDHFNRHGAEVGASDCDQYVRKAEGFKQNLRGAKRSFPDGYTSGATRFTKNGKYIILDPTGNIISFGVAR